MAHRPGLNSFFGSRLSDTITVVLAASDGQFAALTGNRLPEWTAAVAVPVQRRIILKPGSYYDPEVYRESLIHELAHVYFADKTGKGHAPLWLNEGIAMHVSGQSLSWDESIATANAVLGDNILNFSEIDGMLKFGTAKARIAYYQSLLAVRYLLDSYGEAELRHILDALGAGVTIEQHFLSQYGIAYADFEYSYRKWLGERYRWMFLLQFEYLLWFLILLLVFAAIVLVKIRNRRKISQWIEEDDVI
jgi:hypothetical protein